VSFELVGPAGDVAKGTAISVEIDGVDVAVVHADDGEFYAVRDECSHAAVALSEGEVDGCTLECWLHGSRFDLRTGEPTGLPAVEPVAIFPVEIRDGDIYVSTTPSNGVNP
jgi:3-phenylpropionate/trans-cinnamate dioxygenase ferredoxin component